MGRACPREARGAQRGAGSSLGGRRTKKAEMRHASERQALLARQGLNGREGRKARGRDGRAQEPIKGGGDWRLEATEARVAGGEDLGAREAGVLHRLAARDGAVGGHVAAVAEAGHLSQKTARALMRVRALCLIVFRR